MTKGAIILGTTARDKVSGFTGIVHSRTEFLTGNVQYSLQPPAKDGELPELIGFDAHQLETVEGAASVAFIDPPKSTGIELGEKVKDIVTGFVGHATRRVTFLNGCVYYTVQAAYKAEKGATVEDFTEYKRLARIGAGVRAKIEPLVEKVSVTPRAPGGPNTRGMPQRG